MAQRPHFGPLTPPPLGGPAFLAEYKAGLKGLFDAALFPLTSIGGTANTITAALAWDLDGGSLIDGMKFTLTWAQDNTGPVTLALNGGPAAPVLDAAGGSLISGAVRGGTRALIEFIGGAYRVLSGGDETRADQRYFWRYTASGTWAKPVGLSDDTLVFVRAWGGGAGGRESGNSNARVGGGGGGYMQGWFRLGDLPASVSVAIGAGGPPNANGGNTTFGTLLTAYGGNGNLGGAPFGPAGGGGGDWAGGRGGNADDNNAASSVFGGGGGTGFTTGGTFTPGQSIFGGAGGSLSARNGQAPGGGGASGGGSGSGNGARGQMEIWI